MFLSQNFLCNEQIVKKLIRESSVGKNDTVLDIGAGSGIITGELIRAAKEVVAIELDATLVEKLKEKFSQIGNLKLIQGNFLGLPLPQTPYKVFSNLPFSITGEVIRKLLQSTNPPLDSYLVVQKEAAEKFIANSNGNTMATILYYPWWDIQTIYRFERSDFSPEPKVESVLLRIKARPAPLLSDHKDLYLDFVAFKFTRDRLSKHVLPAKWIELFDKFVKDANPKELREIQGAFDKLQHEQSLLPKIRRTRTDRSWKRFRPK